MSTLFPDTHSPALWAPIVLAAVAAEDAGNGVPFRDVVSHVEALDGFPGWDRWGHGKRGRNPNYPRAKRALGLAAKLLSDRGEITCPKKGWYSVATEAAATEAAATVAPATVAPAPATVLNKLQLVPAVDAAPAPVVEETPAAPVVEEVAVADGPATHPLYLASERARKVAVESTPCFGYWSNRSRSCKTCPLAGLCHEARGIKVAEVVSALNAEVVAEAAAEGLRQAAAAEAEAAALEAAERGEPEASDSTAYETWREVSDDVAEEIATASAEADVIADAVMAEGTTPVAHTVTTFGWDIACSGCGEMITAGEDIAHVEGKGGFHVACVPTA